MRFTPFYILVFLLISCHGKIKSDVTLDFEKMKYANDKTALLSIIHGGWVRSDYIHKLKKVRSPFHAYDVNAHFVELIIDTNRTNNGDTIGNPGCLENDTEMNYFKILLQAMDTHDAKSGADSNSAESNKTDANGVSAIENKNSFLIKMTPIFIEGPIREMDFGFSYKINFKDTNLVLTAKHETAINQEIIYKKVYKNPPMHNYQIDPIDYLIAISLFSDTYNVCSPSGEIIQKEVYFDPNEKTNFMDHTMYRIGSDFGDGSPAFDHITFYLDEKEEKFAWRINGNKILLYSLKISGDYASGISRKVSDLKYILVKK